MLYIICLLALIVTAIHLYENELISRRDRKVLFLTIAVIAIEVTIDGLAVYVSKLPANFATLFTTLKTAEFILAPLMPITPLMVFSDTSKDVSKVKHHWLVIILFCINLFLQVVNIFTPITFYVDGENVYHRLPLGYIYLLIVYSLVIMFIYTFYQKSIKIQCKNLTLPATAVFLFIGTVFRLCGFIGADYLTITLVILVLVLSYCDMQLKIDGLTQLLNKRVFDIRKNNIDYSTVVIMIDLNNFKHINDSFGHYNGDIVLKIVAECILNTFKEIAYCYRFGGDEFVVVLKPNMLKSICPDLYQKSNPQLLYEQCDVLMKNMKLNLASYCETIELPKELSPDDISISTGFGIYFTHEDFPTLQDSYFKSMSTVLTLADERMYQDKEHYYKEHARLR